MTRLCLCMTLTLAWLAPAALSPAAPTAPATQEGADIAPIERSSASSGFHTGQMVVKQTTTRATPDKDGWQHVKPDIDSPAWGPAINIVLHADHCTAYLDDFALREVGGE